MPFTNYPPTAPTTDWQDYWAWLTQMVKSLDEVASAAGNGFHPRTTFLWDGNQIPSGGLTATTLTDASKNWAVNCDGWMKRYYSWTNCNPDIRQPSQYDLVLLKLWDGGAWEWHRMLRVPINDQNWIDNGDGTFTSNQLQFPAIDTVEHPLSYFTHYYIQRRDGAFIHDRVPEWPNDLTLEWANAIATNTTSITVDKNRRSWSENQWQSKWVYFTIGGNARSAQITSNDRDVSGNPVLHFAAQAAAPDAGVFGILSSSGLYWRPEHQPQVPDNAVASTAVVPKRAWIRMGEAHNYGYYSHFPDDSRGENGVDVFNFPNPAFKITDTHPLGEDLYVDVINPSQGMFLWGTDVDMFTDGDTTFTPIDWCFTRPYHKTFRSWQSALWQACGGFIPYRSDHYDGSDRFHINPMSVPVFMWEAGVNAAKGTTGNLVRDGYGNVIGIQASMSFTDSIEPGCMPIGGRTTIERVVKWTYDGDTNTWSSEPETHDKGATMVSDAPATWNGTMLSGPDFNETHQNQEVWFTWGFTRLIPDRFRYFYDKECFIPDQDPEAEEDEPAIPPTEDAPGNWYTRPKSAQLIDYDEYGRLAYPLSGFEFGGVAPTVGTLARYVGDNFDDPTTDYQPRQPPFPPKPWEVEYDDHFYEGKRSNPPVRGGRNWDITTGTVTVVDDALQFGDDTKNWWSDILSDSDGAHLFTPTSLSSTSFACTTNAASRFWDGSTQGRWAGHWFIVEQPGASGSGGTAGPCHQATRPITSYNPATQSASFPAIAGLSLTYSYQDAGGNPQTGTTQIRIQEPKWEKNHFKGAVCELRRQSGGGVITGTVTSSANNRIRVDAWSESYTPTIGDTYQLKRVSTGTVWRWDGSNWVKPTGTDAQWTIPPTYRRRYGRLMNNDYIGIQFHTEIFKMRKALRMRKFTVCFTPDADPNTDPPSDNNRQWFRSGDPGGPGGCPGPALETIDDFSGGTCNPVCLSSTNSYCSIGAGRSMGYAQLYLEPGITGAFSSDSMKRLRVAASGKFLTYAQINDFDPDDGLIIDDGLGGIQAQYHFDANGDPVAFRSWKVFDTTAGGTALHRTSTLFGSLNRPTDAAWPNDQRGYTIRQAIAIMDWGGGMQFI